MVSTPLITSKSFTLQQEYAIGGLFYTILDIGALNSFIVLKKNLQAPEMKRRAFLKQLAFSLCKDYAQYRLMHKNNQPTTKQPKTRICEIMGIEQRQDQRALPVDQITSVYVTGRRTVRRKQGVLNASFSFAVNTLLCDVLAVAMQNQICSTALSHHKHQTNH